MLTRKKKEMQATTRLNELFEEELKYTEKDVHNKIDSILRKGKQFYATYRRTGKKLDDQDIELDLEAAKSAWPNFGVFYHCFKNHPALGASTSVEDTIEISKATSSLQTSSSTPTSTPTSTPSSSSTPTISSASTPSSSSAPSPATPATPDESQSGEKQIITCSSEDDDEDSDNELFFPLWRRRQKKKRSLGQLLNKKVLVLSLNSWRHSLLFSNHHKSPRFNMRRKCKKKL